MALCFRLPCRAPAVYTPEPLCSYYCSYSPGKKPQQIERMVISDAEPARGRWRRGALMMEGGTVTERGKKISITAGVTARRQERNLNNHEDENPKGERARWVGGFGDLKTWRRAWLMREERAVRERGGWWTRGKVRKCRKNEEKKWYILMEKECLRWSQLFQLP